MERRGYLDQSLQKCFLRRRGVQPDFLPGFVSFKKVARVEKLDAAREEFCFVLRRFGIA